MVTTSTNCLTPLRIGKTKALLRRAAGSVPPEAQGGHIPITTAFNSE